MIFLLPLRKQGSSAKLKDPRFRGEGINRIAFEKSEFLSHHHKRMIPKRLKTAFHTLIILALSLAAVSPACVWAKNAQSSPGLSMEICSDLGIKTLTLQPDGTFKETAPSGMKKSTDCPVCFAQANMASSPDTQALPMPESFKAAVYYQQKAAIDGAARLPYAARGPPLA